MLRRIKKYIRSSYFIFCNTISQIVGLLTLKDQKYLSNYKINYYSQWESRNLNRSIELHIIEAKEDPLWKNSGAANEDEYQQWSKNICAIACFKMVSDNFGLNSKELKCIALAKESMKYGAYRYKVGGKEIEGIFWKSFQNFILKRYNIKSYVIKCLTTLKIVRLLLDDQIVFLSVSPFIHRNDEGEKITKRGGHIILVHGFASKDGIIQGFFIKDPGAWTENNSQECFVSLKKLLSNYSGRAFVIKNE